MYGKAPLIAAFATLALAGPRAQQPAPYRSNAEVVSVYATVMDRNHRLVPDLDVGDFVIYDNGKEQPISYFSSELQPFSVVMMLDRSGSMEEHYGLVRRAGITFVKDLLPDDRARIGTFSHDIIIKPEDFTSDHDTLIGILQGDLQELGPSPVWTAIDRSISALTSEPGRRVVLVFTDGHNEPRRGQAITDLDDVIRRARYNDIMIYAIGFAGERHVSAPQSRPPTGPTRRPWPPQGGPGRRGPSLPTPLPPQIPRGPQTPRWPSSKTTVEPPDPGLRELADETGGGYFELDANDDLSGTFARVAEELHRQYWLGFVPKILDGRPHRLEVRVRRSDLEVRGRRSYVAATAPTGADRSR